MKEVYFIIYLDLVGYSKNNEPIQVGFFRKFQREIHHLLYEDILKNDCVLIPTGDGMIIGIKNDKDDHYIKCIDLVINIIDWALNNESRMRSSIHVGDVNLLTDINKNKNIVGNTINDAARMLSGAEDDSIIISKSFHDKYLRNGRVVIGKNNEINKDISFVLIDEDSIIDKHSFEHNVYNVIFIKGEKKYGKECKILTKYFTTVYSSDYPKKDNLRDSFFNRVENCSELILFGIYHPNTPKILEKISHNNFRRIQIQIYFASDELENEIRSFFNSSDTGLTTSTKRESLKLINKYKSENPKLDIKIHEYKSFYPFGFSMVDKDVKGNGFIHFSNYLTGIIPADTPYIEVEYKTNIFPPLYKFYKDYISNLFRNIELEEI